MLYMWQKKILYFNKKKNYWQLYSLLTPRATQQNHQNDKGTLHASHMVLNVHDINMFPSICKGLREVVWVICDQMEEKKHA